jgi:hypothetical protein
MLKHPHFKGNTLITGIIPATCLFFLTLGTVSVYWVPCDLTPLTFISIMIFILIPLVVFLHMKNNRVEDLFQH